MDEETKAIEKIAETTGKAIDATRELGGFVARYIRGPLEQALGIVEDKLKYMRWERQVRLMKRADELLREIGLEAPTQPVPLKIAIPLLQGGSLEEDDTLQDLWAKLLVNAVDAERKVEIRCTHISILEDLGSLEVRILEKIYSLPKEVALQGIWTKEFPSQVLLEQPAGEDLRPPPEVEVALGNLVRLGCLTAEVAWGGVSVLSCVYPTMLGRSFVEVCTLRTS